MALTINTNIKNDAGGYLLDADAVKAEGGLMLDKVLPKVRGGTGVVPTTLLTQEEYDELVESGEIEETRLYLIYEVDEE